MTERKQVWPIEEVIKYIESQLEVPPAELPAGRELDEKVCRYFGEHDSHAHIQPAFCIHWVYHEAVMKQRLHERGIYVMAGYHNGNEAAAYAVGLTANPVTGDTPSHAVARLIAQLAQEDAS